MNRTAGSVAAVLVMLLAGVVVLGATGVRADESQDRQSTLRPVPQCRITDERLTELSGLVSDGETWYAVSDGGKSLKVYLIEPGTCTVRDVRTAAINPYDVEDLELDADGDLWLADIGDNSLRRDTVAIHVMRGNGNTERYRLKYPDGPHNAEAMLLGPHGVPYIVTKSPLGPAGIYRPAVALSAKRAVWLEKVGTVALGPTETPGGPLPGAVGSSVVTAGAVSHDGSVVAIRTYTDAYLFPVSGRNLVAALDANPLRIPLPHEPQGEAVAFTPDGTLLSASEGNARVRAVSGAVDAATQAHPRPTTPRPTTPDSAASARGAEINGAEVNAAGASGEQGFWSPRTVLVTGVSGCFLVAVLSQLWLRRRRR